MRRLNRRMPAAGGAPPPPPPPPDARTSPLAWWGATVLVAAIVAFVHWPVLHAGALQLDDREFVTENPLVMNPSWASTGRFFGDVLNPSTIDWFYMPLTMTSLMVDYALGGRASDLRQFHVTSLALHVFNTLFILWIVHALFGGIVPAAITALLFGLHPLTIEPIAWVADRKTLLAMFFALASMLAYVQYVRRGGFARMMGVAFLYLLADLSKPSAITLPIGLLLLDIWPFRRFGMRAVTEKWPLYLLMVAAGVVTLISYQGSGGITPPDLEQWPARTAYVLGFYLHKMVWPGQLSSIYPNPDPLSFANPVIAVSMIVVILLTALVVILARRTPGPLMAWLFFVIGLAPTMGLIQYSWVIVSDRYLYYTVIGVLILIGAGLATAWRWLRRAGWAAAAAGLLAMSVILAAESRGIRQALPVWKDSLTLWRHTVAVAPRSTEAHNGLAVALQMAGAYEESIQEHRLALSLGPSPPTRQLNFGALLSRLGRHEESIEEIRAACERMPNNVAALHQLAIALARAQRLDEAEAILRRQLRIRRHDLQAQSMLGLMRMVRGHPKEGITMLRSVLARSPHDERASYNLAISLIRVPGHHGEVLDLLRQAIRRKPDWVDPYRVLAWLQATNPDASLRDPAEALRLANRAVDLSQENDPDALDAQAAAHAALGNFAAAGESARKALAVARDSTAGGNAERIRQRLALYERRVAYTEATGSDSSLTLR